MGNTTYMNGFGRASVSPLAARTDEGHLVNRLKKRDEAAYVVFVQKHKGAVYNVCLRMLSNAHEAEDIAQEVFMRAFVSIGSFREEAKLATWLYRIAMNLCRNRIKYHQRRAANRHMSVDTRSSKVNINVVAVESRARHRPHRMSPSRLFRPKLGYSKRSYS